LTPTFIEREEKNPHFSHIVCFEGEKEEIKTLYFFSVLFEMFIISVMWKQVNPIMCEFYSPIIEGSVFVLSH
jgi:hypothetical protein